MASQPEIPDVTMPTIIGASRPSGMPSPTSFVILNTIAPPVTGIIIKKLSRTAASRSKPRRRAAVIVIPERDVPGLSASACAAPTMTESRTP